ncbi:hypothetical protein F5X96DRAFT_630465 [Biscogniauxia mediterranea]|nr:hypothetical protein F5X96DRAFT_630465 [Biscogniauxia mediterranea]
MSPQTYSILNFQMPWAFNYHHLPEVIICTIYTRSLIIAYLSTYVVCVAMLRSKELNNGVIIVIVVITIIISIIKIRIIK